MVWLSAAAAVRPVAAVEHVIHISVDGLRSSLLLELVEAEPLAYANFKRFMDEGATTLNARTDYTYTSTLPNHTTMLTGRPVSQPSGFPNTVHHGYTDNGTPGSNDTLHNSGNPNVSYLSSTFDVAHDHGLSTAMYASKNKFILYEQSYNATNGALDLIPPDDGRDKIDTYAYTASGSPSNAAPMHAAYLADMAATQYDYSFVHYRDPDSAGHASGWGSSTWDNAVEDVDGYLGDILAMIESQPGLVDQTVVIVTADHGGSGTGHNTSTEASNYTIPFLVWGPGVARGGDLYDLNASSSRLDPGSGRPDYTAAVQPIRNGDSGNLALELLGLPPIDGSLINAAQDLIIARLGDMDLDHDVDVDDVQPFVQGLADSAAYAATYGIEPVWSGDMDNDGDIDLDDVSTFVDMLSTGQSGSSMAVPEPSSVLLLGLGAAIIVLPLHRRR